MPNIVMTPGDAVPTNIIMYVPEDMPLPVYPSPADVDVTSLPYGPTGTEYTGTLVLPAVTDVKVGVMYGGGGTEFTGTLAAGGLANGTILLDPVTGKQYVYLNSVLVVAVND